MGLEKKRKGLFYTADALLAVSILLIFMLVAIPLVKVNTQKSDLQYDLMNALSSMKVGDMDPSYIPAGLTIQQKDTNKSVIEFLAELYIADPVNAETLAKNIIGPLDVSENVGLYFNGKRIYSKNVSSVENAKNVDVSKQFISGVSSAGSQTGFSVRAFLTKSMKSKYYYFGGYVGDGNISLLVNYSGVLSSGEMELSASKDFDLYIDGIYIDHYAGSSNKFIPNRYILSQSALDELDPNVINIIELRNSSGGLGISGGYLRLNYKSDVEPEATYRYYFPGIEGLTNLYDSVYVPPITNLRYSLHFQSSKQILLRLGNTTIYSGSRNTESTVSDTVANTNGFYNSISQKNVPLRLALREFIDSSGSVVQVILVTDLSASMKKSLRNVSENGNVMSSCSGSYTDLKVRKDDLARCLDIDFATQLLGIDSRHYLWPVKFGIIQGEGNFNQVLSLNYPHDINRINQEINSYSGGEPKGQTCLACAINEGYNLINSIPEQPGVNYVRYIILMTDGMPTHVPSDWNQATQSSTTAIYGNNVCGSYDDGYCDTTGSCKANLGTTICSRANSYCDEAINATIAASRRAYNNLNATVLTIGFGDVESCDKANYSLGVIAGVGNGTYYHSSNPSALADIYDDIIDKIFKLVYDEQIASVSGDGSFSNRLYPDSYLEFTYNAPAPIAGLKFPVQKNFTTENGAILTMYPDDRLVDAKIISYSGSKWTENVTLRNSNYNNMFLNLREFGPLQGNLTGVGDPFNVYLPISNIVGGNNYINLSLSPYQESVRGSLYNKIIYTVLRNVSSFSGIKLTAEGCRWSIPTDGNGVITMYIPEGYAGSNTCTFGNTDYSNSADAYIYSAYSLLQQLDLDDNGKIDVNLDKEFFNISSTEIEDIPINWKTYIEVRTWS